MTRLTDTELLILNAAAQRDDKALDLSSAAEDEARTKAVLSLLRRKLIERPPSTPGLPFWKLDGDERVSLILSKRGFDALGIEDGYADPTAKQEKEPRPSPSAPLPKTKVIASNRIRPPQKAASHTSKAGPKAKASAKKKAPSRDLPQIAVRAGTKAERIIGLLRAKSGASVSELASETGWKTHSVRGAISGLLKKKLQLNVQSTKSEDGERRYRIET